ncbi:carbohydrate ABC transporter membrane protein 1 (CUT1 family) [Hoeflea marina]|uniref:Carbohydrate ABC transporter membrane protein 1 (CUT1 family) n=1 Tax=Hoeflea marina TaxID=274592 RepID=A0A317PNV2_9HYPH|nr:sugar ABC transporter permease [Hoeflea marina]PWW01931.1 carbohydrate ABC transporter membrane protein 1 (CUT1 family) [Hoeflea marina]
MRRQTFWKFVGPSIFLMVLFIALPLASVFWQSFFHSVPSVESVEVETCSPGFPTQICETVLKSRAVLDENGRPVTTTHFVGLDFYRSVVEPDVVWQAFSSGNPAAILRIDFWRALRFTVTFTFITLPFVLGLGLAIALAVNNSTARMRGPIIFVSLLPYIITPVIGGISIYWLFVGDGIVTRLIEAMLDRNIAVMTHGWAVEALMMFYRVWHIAPFAFVIFYAGLQGVNRDTLESAMIDGASRFERLRYVIIPHLLPLIVFVTLIHLMDSYRVFEEIVAFNAQSQRISLQWLTYDFLQPDDSGNRAIGRASASSMLTMIGIVLIILPVLRRAWRDHRA